MQKAIALSANYAYLDNAETTIKSIIYNNQNVKIYLFNYDIPQEWFINVNQYVNQIGSEIIDKKFDPSLFDDVHVSHTHINKMSYGRCLIPKDIKDNRVLYLDSDIIVNQDIGELFTIKFENTKLMAVKDNFLNEYNTGVMVLNNKELKKDRDITDKLINLGNNKSLSNGDQSVINDYFREQIKEIPAIYNYQIGLDLIIYCSNLEQTQSFLNTVTDPKIIHYTTYDKPFNMLSSGRMREKWWFYRNLEWAQIVQKYTVFDLTKIGPQEFNGQVFIFTNSQDIQNLKELVEALPNIRFNIAAYTDFGWKLKEFIKYPNVKLYRVIISENQKLLIKTADVYLDINYGNKSPEITDRVKMRNIPFLSFEDTADKNNTYSNYTMFGNDQVDQMVERIKEIIATKNPTLSNLLCK